MSKLTDCRYALVGFQDDGTPCGCCRKNDTLKDVLECDCEKCEDYKSRYIEYPITVDKIDTCPIEYNSEKIGEYVRIRPCAEKYENKTYLGTYIGELPMCNRVQYNEKTNELSVVPVMNPAIYVPKLKKIIFGAESWWGFITSREEFNSITEITDEEIRSQPYFKLLKMFGKKD